MAAKPSPLHLRAWRVCLTAYSKVLAQLEHELREEGNLALDWYEVLLLLHENEDGLRMHELADVQLLSRSAATRLIDRMEAAGLVQRRTAEDDRRGTFVELTAEGLSTLRRTAPIHLRGIQSHFARHLADDEARLLANVMGRMVEELGAQVAEG